MYAVVYGGFILQGVSLAVAFALHLRARWGGILGGSGGEAGLPSALRGGQSLTQQVMDASSAALALAGLLGLVDLVSRRPRGLRTWVPLAAAWIGAGSMFCSGAYQFVILLAPGSPFEASGGGGSACCWWPRRSPAWWPR